MRRRSRWLALAVVVGVPYLASAQVIGAPERGASALSRALMLEQASRYREAAASYREAIGPMTLAPALLGLERVYAELQWGDSLLPLLDSLIRARPREVLPRVVQLRTLRSGGHDRESTAAFERWTRDFPRDPTPYREYVRMLLQDGRPAAADSILQRAQRALGAAREFGPEIAQLRASLGLWEPAARSWRDVLGESPVLVQAAVFALQPAPVDARGGIRAVLRAAPLALGARRALAQLELGWGAPSAAWLALADVPPSDSAVTAWMELGEIAEGLEQWTTARDAFSAVLRVRSTPVIAARGANAALAAGDPKSAAAIAERGLTGDSTVVGRVLVPVAIRAMASASRAADAQRVYDAYAARLDSASRGALIRAIAWGWVRAGDIARARVALDASGPGDDEGATGWLLLYEGDLLHARTELRHASDASPALVAARALLARTHADRSPEIGNAFLLLARGDSAGAAAAFASAADRVGDVAPLLLATSARIRGTMGQGSAALALWDRVLAQFSASPEAPEADLEAAKLLERSGERDRARQHLEHLILTYPESALVPQARQELERLRGGVPSNS